MNVYISQKSFAIKPIENQEEWEAVVAAAKEDDHYPHAATHFVSRHGEVVGTFNIGPFVNWWMRSDQKKYTSIKALIEAQRLLREAKYQHPVWLISRESPYIPYMERSGFQDVDSELKLFFQIEEFQDVFRSESTA